MTAYEAANHHKIEGVWPDGFKRLPPEVQKEAKRLAGFILARAWRWFRKKVGL